MILVTDGRVINITEGQELTSIESKNTCIPASSSAGNEG